MVLVKSNLFCWSNHIKAALRTSRRAQFDVDRRTQLDERVLPASGVPAVDHGRDAQSVHAAGLVDVSAQDQRRVCFLD